MPQDEPKVENTEVKETPVAEPTPPQTTEQPATDTGTVEKQSPEEATDRFDKHPRFQEVITQKNKAKEEADTWKQKYYDSLEQAETRVPESPKEAVNDPYSGLPEEEAKQTKAFIDKFILPTVEAKYKPFLEEFQTEKLNKQINEAKDFSSKFGIDFDEKLPEVVQYLSRPENRGRLTATEAVRNLYFDDITNSVKTNTTESVQKERDELIAKKKNANMQTTTVSHNTVIQSDQMARAKMTKEERLRADIMAGIELAKQGVRNPNVKVD